ncbi:MAG TPA: hypothetical protein VGK48_27575 [Terriglobia bacterium]|jgi:hypothetical protein
MKKRNLILLCITFVLGAGVPPAGAQSLGLTPAEFQYRFKPGQPFQFEIAMSNTGSTPAAMRANITDLWYNAKNEKLFNPAGSSPRSAANWIEVVPPQVMVPAGGTGKVKVVVTPPADASGGYYGVVFLESRPELTQAATAESKAVFANIRLGSLILLSAENTEKYGIDISDPQLTPPDATHPLKLDFDLANNSNTHIFPETKIAILNSDHQLAAKSDGAIQRFLPEQKDRLSVSWAGALPKGDYTAILTVVYGPDKVDTKEIPFTVTDSPKPKPAPAAVDLVQTTN